MATLAATRRINARTSLQNALHGLAGILGMGILAFGIHQSTHSRLFVLREVRVHPPSEGYPLTEAKILEMAKVPVGSSGLFDLNLEPIKARLIKHPWVKGVVVGKQFPNTLSLTVIERHPVALLNEVSGRVLYLEEDGTAFEDQAMTYPEDLPIFSGFPPKNIDTLKQANAFVQIWFSAEHFPGLRVSSLSYDEKMGLRAVVVSPQKNHRELRVVVELGLNLEEAMQVPFDRFQKVLQYLSDHSMQASKVWLGDGKKIVVKVLKGP